ncbi:PREDICTED: uncharacterized protein LOC106749024 [Dinoponera quadriceps]|uniref:Uncharacterized protein LOC106749024 n=1 Tax=Dinoponera quadriceps TaxID=609295 RepID=A0A6P3XZN8_DINQU|nr:PREDICTED: uncharacterized protein LOC106749024 [Dinoponera quadriceps]
MSARVLNPAMMTEMSRNLGGGGGGGGGGGAGGGGGRPVPSRAALARVRRDLFGPVDHVAARALAERELRAQSLLDAERWGFDFHLEIPRPNLRYEWELVTAQDVVPEPYALRGMPYLRKHAPGASRKSRADDTVATTASSTTTTVVATSITTTSSTTMITARITEQTETTNATSAATLMAIGATERTPPQEARVPEIGDATTPGELLDANAKRKRCPIEPTTPVLPLAARKQSAITDFMKSRKRGLNGTTKSMIEPPEKIARNAGQIRS